MHRDSYIELKIAIMHTVGMIGKKLDHHIELFHDSLLLFIAYLLCLEIWFNFQLKPGYFLSVCKFSNRIT